MAVAIFNGFQFHYELFGCMLAFCRSRDITPTLYTECIGDMGWFDVYRKAFPNLVVHPYRTYRPDMYDVLILLTDDDKKYKRFCYGRTRVIVFEHFSSRRIVWPNATAYIQMRRYMLRDPPSPEDTWMLPVWNIGRQPKYDQLTVVAIGNNCPDCPEELTRWFPNYATIQFILINRRPAPNTLDPQKWKDHANVTLYENIDADVMLEAATRAHWLLFLPKNGYQYQEAPSAIVPLGYGVGTPVLVIPEWIDAYNLPGLVSLNAEAPLAPPTQEQQSAWEQGALAMLERRDRVLGAALNSALK